MKRLAVFTHKLFRCTPDGLKTTGGFAIQMDALAPYYDQVLLCVPIVNDPGFRGVGITAPNIGFHPLPYYRGRMEFLKAMSVIRHEMLTVMQRTDLALGIMPGYVGALASIFCQRQHFPLFLWIVGDWGQNVRMGRQNPLARWWASTVWATLLDWLVARLTRDVLAFYNGRILYDQGKPYHFIRVSSSIRRVNFYVRDAASLPTLPYQLLFVGRLSPEKGITHLLEAVSLLIAKGEAVELHIVGIGPLETELQQQTQTLSIADYVHFHGFVPQGETMRQLYRESDLFVLPSLQDQQPKVLMEAMSQSVPVIATNAGGIPSVIRDGENGILVPPAQPEAIATAVQQGLKDDQLRWRLIKEGLAYAGTHTVEQETAWMMKIVDTHFNRGELQYDTNT